MKLSKILKAICGKMRSSKPCDTPETSTAVALPPAYHYTPIYDSECSPFRGYTGHLTVKNPDSHYKVNNDHTTALTESHMLSAPPFSPLIDEKREIGIEKAPAQEELVHELATSPPYTTAQSTQGNSIPSTIGPLQRTCELASDDHKQSFEQELSRLSGENERRQRRIHNLESELRLLERKSHYLQAGQLPCHQVLNQRISELSREVQRKETKPKDWAAVHSKAVKLAQAHVRTEDERSEVMEALKLMQVDLKASECLLREVDGELKDTMRQKERKNLSRQIEAQAESLMDDSFNAIAPVRYIPYKAPGVRQRGHVNG